MNGAPGAVVVTGFMMVRGPARPPLGTVWIQPMTGDVPVEIRRIRSGASATRWFQPALDGSLFGMIWDEPVGMGEPVEVVITGEPVPSVQSR